jgi:hypothetical protein
MRGVAIRSAEFNQAVAGNASFRESNLFDFFCLIFFSE